MSSPPAPSLPSSPLSRARSSNALAARCRVLTAGGWRRVGLVLTSVQGHAVTGVDADDVLDMLRESGRPLQLGFVLPPGSASRRGRAPMLPHPAMRRGRPRSDARVCSFQRVVRAAAFAAPVLLSSTGPHLCQCAGSAAPSPNSSRPPF